MRQKTVREVAEEMCITKSWIYLCIRERELIENIHYTRSGATYLINDEGVSKIKRIIATPYGLKFPKRSTKRGGVNV